MEEIKLKFKCPICDNNWDKEFIDMFMEVGDSDNEWIDLGKNDIEKIIKKYDLFNKIIKIKCKDGCIQIERIK